MVDKQNQYKKQMQARADQAWLLLQASQFAEAQRAYEEAVDLARQLGDGMAATLFASYLAVVKQGLGQHDQARSDLETCLQAACELGSLQLEAHVRFLLAESFAEEFNHDAAAHELCQALEAALAADDAALTEMCFGKLGLIYFASGWMEQASQCFRQALAARPDSANACAWLGNLGQTLSELGANHDAIETYRKALLLAVATDNLPAQGKCLASEALSHYQNDNHQAAIDCYQKALVLAEASGDQKSKGVWLGNLGNLYLRLGQLDKAEELCSQGLTLARQLQDRHAEAAHLDSLGDCQLRKGDAAAALDRYQEALSIGQDISDKLGERIYAANVGRAYVRLGERDKAFANLSAAIEIFDEQRNRINSDNLKTSFAGAGQMLYQDMIALCLDSGRRVDALQYVGRSKSRAILDLLRNSPIDVSDLAAVSDQSIAALVEKEMHLRSQIEGLERLYWQGPAGPSSGTEPGGEASDGGSLRSPGTRLSAEDAPQLYRAWRDVVDELRRRHPNYATMVAVQTLNFGEIQSLWQGVRAPLPAGTAVIEFYLSAQFLYAAGIFKDASEPCTHTLNGADSIAALSADIADFLEMSATEGWAVPVSLCQRLYKQLIGPVLAQMPTTIDRLILVPHGVLHRLPFAALHTGQGFLAQRYALSSLPSLSLIPALSERRHEAGQSGSQEKNKYLVSAISDYSATRGAGISFSARLRSAAGLDDLGYTMEEARTVFDLAASHGGDARLLTNEDVKEGLLSMFGSYPVVHFAGHAVFNPDEPLASGLVLADAACSRRHASCKIRRCARVVACSWFCRLARQASTLSPPVVRFSDWHARSCLLACPT